SCAEKNSLQSLYGQTQLCLSLNTHALMSSNNLLFCNFFL
ncbi:hypothetical protein HMPREF9373_2107, partial [Psychrobacter sp. 1501(2011)]